MGTRAQLLVLSLAPPALDRPFGGGNSPAVATSGAAHAQPSSFPHMDAAPAGGRLAGSPPTLPAPRHIRAFRRQHHSSSRAMPSRADIRGTVEFDREGCLTTRFEGRIDATRIWTGENDRNAHLRSADFFEVENHPAITFAGRFTERIDDSTSRAKPNSRSGASRRPCRSMSHGLANGAHRSGWATRTVARCAASASRRRRV